MDQPSELGARRFLVDPHYSQPYVNLPKGYGLIWSAKSACTTALLWHLHHCGLLHAALFHSPWPHAYRAVMHQAETYRYWLRTVDLEALRWIRVIRDPYKRAVSSYRHAVQHGYENAGLAAGLGRPVTPEDGFSFAEFLAHLARLDLRTCDPHHQIQYHPIEDHVRPALVVNADRRRLEEALGDADVALLGAPRSTPVIETVSRTILKFHAAKRFESAEDCSERRFTRADSLSAWPDYDAFLNEGTRARIAALYGRDLEAYADAL